MEREEDMLRTAADRLPGLIAEEMAPLLDEAIDQRFASGAAPVDSGRLRGSFRVVVDGDTVRVRSDLPYAQRHPEALPPPDEIERIAQQALDRALRRL